MRPRYIYKITNVDTNDTIELGSMKKVGHYVGVSAEAKADKTTWLMYSEIGVRSRTGEFSTRYKNFAISRVLQGNQTIVEPPVQEPVREIFQAPANNLPLPLASEFSLAYEIFLAGVEDLLNEHFNNAREISNRLYPEGAPNNPLDNHRVLPFNMLDVIRTTRNVWQHARGTHYFDKSMELGIEILTELNKKL